MQRVRSRPAILCALLAAAVAGCGGGGGSLPASPAANGAPSGPKGLLYTRATDPRQAATIQAAQIAATQKLFGPIKLDLDCKDGSSSRVTLSTGPNSPRPTLWPDGSFYYSEAGRTTNRQFPGFGAGRYRGAMQGDIVGLKGSGHAAFRITFKETSCRAAVKWAVKRGG